MKSFWKGLERVTKTLSESFSEGIMSSFADMYGGKNEMRIIG